MNAGTLHQPTPQAPSAPGNCRARAQVAELLGASDPEEIVFTSCGSESDNWAIGGFLEQNPDKRHIITTRVEHEAVRNLCAHLEEIGCEVTWLEVDEGGELDLDDLRKALRRETGIVSVMLANNETGVLFPVAEIGRIIRENSDAVFHVDGVQAVGKIPINLKDLPVDYFQLPVISSMHQKALARSTSGEACSCRHSSLAVVRNAGAVRGPKPCRTSSPSAARANWQTNSMERRHSQVT